VRLRNQKRKSATSPLPEAVADGRWRIDSGLPMVDIPGRIMSVPLEQTETAEFLRAHEMAHVKITPHKHASQLAAEAGVSMPALQAVEDFRVHEFLKSCGFKMQAPMTRHELGATMEQVKDPKIAASMLLAVYDCNAQAERVREALRHSKNFGTLAANDIEKIVRSAVNMFYELCSKNFKVRPLHTPEGFAEVTAPVARYFDSLFSDNELIPAMEYASYPRVDDHVPWGELSRIIRAPLAAPKKSKHGVRRVWRDEGVIPVAPYRLTIDNKVFARTKKATSGGTVLVDASGSMNFSEKDLINLIAVAPGATVAAYAGEGASGVLVIAAARGKIASEAAISKAFALRLHGEDADDDDDCVDHFMTGNVIDGPALRWLARQPGPRVWISDGMVTGVDDKMSLNLRADAVSLMRQHNIVRMNNWRELLDAIV